VFLVINFVVLTGYAYALDIFQHIGVAGSTDY